MLIDEIIDLLSTEGGPLTTALLKTKVLLHRIGKKDLSEWVNWELNGYPDDVVVPSYRILQSKLVGNFGNIAWKYPNHPLPTSHLKPEIRKHYNEFILRDSLSVIEGFGKRGSLAREVPPEAYRMLGKGLESSLVIDRAWCETPGHDVRGVLTQVRSRLLDFLLELKSGIGATSSEQDMQEKAKKFDADALFQHVVIGDNATVVLGSHNSISVRNEVRKGDFDSLALALAKAGIPDDEISTLRVAVAEDEAEGGASLSEGKTGSWCLRLLGKAAKGSIKVGTDVVSKVVTDALTAYIGGA